MRLALWGDAPRAHTPSAGHRLKLDHVGAVRWLKTLLGTRCAYQPGRRGRWWCRLRVDFTHLKRYADAERACEDGLADAAVRGAPLALHATRTLRTARQLAATCLAAAQPIRAVCLAALCALRSTFRAAAVLVAEAHAPLQRGRQTRRSALAAGPTRACHSDPSLTFVRQPRRSYARARAQASIARSCSSGAAPRRR